MRQPRIELRLSGLGVSGLHMECGFDYQTTVCCDIFYLHDMIAALCTLDIALGHNVIWISISGAVQS